MIEPKIAIQNLDDLDNKFVHLKGMITNEKVRKEIQGALSQVSMNDIPECLLIISVPDSIVLCPASYWECEKEIKKQCSKEHAPIAILQLLGEKAKCGKDKRTVVYFDKAIGIYCIVNAGWLEATNTEES